MVLAKPLDVRTCVKIVESAKWRQSVQRNTDSGCCDWTAGKNSGGYGYLKHEGRQLRAARVAKVAQMLEDIPCDMVVDHLCRRPMCVNPDHLEVVTYMENTLRGDNFMRELATKTHCDRGHRLVKDGNRRGCLRCEEERIRRRDQLVRDAAAALGLKWTVYVRTFGAGERAARAVLDPARERVR
jgi:hypothetical protein